MTDRPTPPEKMAEAAPVAPPDLPQDPIGLGEAPRNESVRPVERVDRPWYTDPPKLVGVLGFALALATVGERLWVREQEVTSVRLQQLRDATTQLADIQTEYLEAVAAAPSNLYALGVAKNTKRQMYLQTAAALLEHAAVKRQTSSQVLAALGTEWMTDGRYDLARTYLTDALLAPGADEPIQPFLLRSLGGLYKLPNTGFANPKLSRDYYDRALALLDKRPDDTAHLTYAETLLAEASIDVIYGHMTSVKRLAGVARERLGRVRAVSPMKTQLERLAAAYERGEQYAQTQAATLQPQRVVPGEPLPSPVTSTTPPVGDSVAAASSTNALLDATIEAWRLIPGQISGVEMDVLVDGQLIGQISNINGASPTLKLSKLSGGLHKFVFANMKAYFVDPVKGLTLSGSGFTCDGRFELSPGQPTLRANVGSGPNGMMCALR
jgi:hypothetical protein